MIDSVKSESCIYVLLWFFEQLLAETKVDSLQGSCQALIIWRHGLSDDQKGVNDREWSRPE